MANLVRSGTKQPQLFTASAADQARLLISKKAASAAFFTSAAALALCLRQTNTHPELPSPVRSRSVSVTIIIGVSACARPGLYGLAALTVEPVAVFVPDPDVAINADVVITELVSLTGC